MGVREVLPMNLCLKSDLAPIKFRLKLWCRQLFNGAGGARLRFEAPPSLWAEERTVFATPSPALPHINGEGRFVEKPVRILLIC